MRKMDRRPASMVDTSYATSSSSVWRSNYLIELQYPASHAQAAEDKIRRIVTELSSGGIAETLAAGGGWRLCRISEAGWSMERHCAVASY